MRLTPLDIRKQEFSRGFRGFDAEEVAAFLQMVANQWEELQDENRRREERIRELENKLQHYEKVEEALQEALQTARESSRKALQNAEEKAAMLIDQAEARADEIKREAERERHDLKRESAKLSGRRSEIVSRLRAFLMSEMELLARYEGDDPVGFIKLLPAEDSRLRRLSRRLEEPEKVEGDQGAEATTDNEAGELEKAHGEDEPVEPGQPKQEAATRRGPNWTETTSPPGRAETARTADTPEYSESASYHAAQQTHRRGAVEGESSAGSSRHEPSREQESPSSDEADRYVEPGEGASEDVLEGPGWTARTVVSRPYEPHSSESGGAGRSEMDDDRDEEEEETSTRASSEEIEKIRRILSDLD